MKPKNHRVAAKAAPPAIDWAAAAASAVIMGEGPSTTPFRNGRVVGPGAASGRWTAPADPNEGAAAAVMLGEAMDPDGRDFDTFWSQTAEGALFLRDHWNFWDPD